MREGRTAALGCEWQQLAHALLVVLLLGEPAIAGEVPLLAAGRLRHVHVIQVPVLFEAAVVVLDHEALERPEVGRLDQELLDVVAIEAAAGRRHQRPLASVAVLAEQRRVHFGICSKTTITK